MFAIDVHVHVKTGDNKGPLLEQQQAGARAFKTNFRSLGPDDVAQLYRERDMMACIFDVDKTTAANRSNSNDEIAAHAAAHPDVFIPVASVDPRLGKKAVEEAERCIGTLGMRGFKFQPVSQGFYPNDPEFNPLWETIDGLGVPVIIHSGTTAIGQGTPGGSGLRLDYARPVPYLDDLAARFPNLTIIAAHPGWPWHEELLAVVNHKGNVYMDLSGWAPKYFPPVTVKYAKSMISDKVLFGTDFPLFSPDRWMEEFDEYGFPDDVKQKIYLDNAKRVFKIE